MKQPNGSRLNGNGKKEANRDTLAKKCEKVIVHLEAAFAIADSEIKSALNKDNTYLGPNEHHVLSEYYEAGKKHDEIAVENNLTPDEVCEIRKAGLKNIAQSTGERIDQIALALNLVRHTEEYCSPSAIDELLNTQKS